MTITTGTLRVGILAILAGLIGAYVIQQVLSNKPVPVKAAPRILQVPIAASALPTGRVIALGDIVLVNMTNKELGEKGIPISTVMLEPSQIVGRRLRNDLELNGLFSTTDLYLQYGGPNIAEKLKPGYRAYSLSLPNSVGARYQSGMMVDVNFKTIARPPQNGFAAIPEMTVSLMQGLEVINVDVPPPPATPPRSGSINISQRNRGVGGPPPATVTLAVTPEQGKILQTAMGHGEVTLSQWSAKDSVAAPASKQGLTLEEILGIPPPTPVVYTPPFVTETYRRGSADIRGYARDAIFRWDSPKPNRPGDLPNPNALPRPVPAPAPKPMPGIPGN